MTRCTGHCCRRFHLDPDAVERLLHEPETLRDGVQIRDMLLPTGEEDYWTCVNYDPEGTACKIYDERPEMCREHPPSGACSYEGCTLSGDELKEYQK